MSIRAPLQHKGRAKYNFANFQHPENANEVRAADINNTLYAANGDPNTLDFSTLPLNTGDQILLSEDRDKLAILPADAPAEDVTKMKRRLGINYLSAPTDIVEAELSTEYESNPVYLPAGVVTITGGTMTVDGSTETTFTSTGCEVVVFTVTSSDQYETAVNVVISIDGETYDTWTVTTMAEEVGIAAKYTNVDHYIGTENYE